jgi:hypothetical protein
MEETNKRRATDRTAVYERSVDALGYALGAAAAVGTVLAIAVAL